MIIERNTILKNVKRVVIKVGTNLLSEKGNISLNKFGIVVNEIAELKKIVQEVVVVTSGAIGAGYTKILKTGKPNTIPLKQASASIGQVLLMKHYMDLFSKHGFEVGQILLTDDVLNNRERYVNAKNTLSTLLQYNVIPIVNENDTVAVDEIKFGENDTLSALVTSLIDGDLLILLSDVDGFYLDYLNPEKRQKLDYVDQITEDIENEAKSPGSEFSTGGMLSKIKAAKITTHNGIPLLIAGGKIEGIIKRIFNTNNEGTLFLPTKEEVLENRKRWFHLNSRAKGKIFIDENAVKALVEKRKSLLPVGITHVEGIFKKNDTVEIYSPDGNLIAKGLTNYNHIEIEKIKGAQSIHIKDILGYQYYDFVVRNDNMVIMEILKID